MDLQKIIGWLSWIMLCVAITVLAFGVYRVRPPSAKECLELAAGFVGLIFFFLLLGRSTVSAYFPFDDRSTNPEMYWYNIRLLAYSAAFFVFWATYRAIVTGQFSN
jgi:hypothetical protein